MNERFGKAFEMTKLLQGELADFFGVNRRTLIRLKNGEANTVSLDLLHKLHTAFEIDLNWLICGKESYGTNIPGLETVNEPAIPYAAKYTEHLEEENKWLREKYDKLLSST